MPSKDTQRGEVVKKALEMSGRIGADTVAAWPLFTGASKICRPIAQVVKTKLSPEQLQRLEYVERSANTIDMVFDETAQAYVMKEVVAGELIPIAASAELVPLAPVISQAVEEGAELANAAKAAAIGNVAENTTDLVEKQRELLQTLDKIKDQKIIQNAKHAGSLLTEEAAKQIWTDSNEFKQLLRQVEDIMPKTSNKRFGLAEEQITSSIKYLEIAEQKEKFYNQIRKQVNDIEKITQNTGISRNIIEKIKNHLFIDEHVLDNCISKFDIDIDIAEAWERLINGSFVQSDLQLLIHEYAESLLLQGTQIEARAGHDIVDKYYNYKKYVTLKGN